MTNAPQRSHTRWRWCSLAVPPPVQALAALAEGAGRQRRPWCRRPLALLVGASFCALLFAILDQRQLLCVAGQGSRFATSQTSNVINDYGEGHGACQHCPAHGPAGGGTGPRTILAAQADSVTRKKLSHYPSPMCQQPKHILVDAASTGG